MKTPEFSVEVAHRFFGIEYNNGTWNLLEKQNRSAEEDLKLVHGAHASLAHWAEIGNAANRQRGECLVALVHAALGDSTAALRHAQVCLQLLQDHSDLMADWDYPFVWDAMARAHQCAGNSARAEECLQEAAKAADQVADPEDRKIFDAWHATY